MDTELLSNSEFSDTEDILTFYAKKTFMGLLDTNGLCDTGDLSDIFSTQKTLEWTSG